MHDVDREHKHTRTSYEFKDTVNVKPIHKERIQILWRAGKPTVPHHEAVMGESDQQNQVWEKNNVTDVPPENMTDYLKFIGAAVPGMDEKFLEAHYAFMNQAGNSAVHQHGKDGKEAPQSSGFLSETPNHQDLTCNYDPYHMHNIDMGLQTEIHN